MKRKTGERTESGDVKINWAFGLGVMTFVVIAGAFLYRFWWRDAIEIAAHEQAIRAQGLPIELAELDSLYPPVPDEENAARIYEEMYPILEQIDPGGERLKVLWDRMKVVGGNQVLPQDFRTALDDYLAEGAEVVNLCERATSRTRVRFPVKMSDGLKSEEGHRDYLTRAKEILLLASVVAIEDRDWPRVVAIHRSMAHLAHIAEAEPRITSQLFRIACHKSAMKSLARALNHGPVPVELLRELAAIHDMSEGREAARLAFAVERCGAVHAITQSLSDAEGRVNRRGGPDWMGRLIVEERTQRRMHYQYLGEFVALRDSDWPEWVAYGRRADVEARNIPERLYGPKIILPTYAKVAASHALGAAAQRATRTAIAIELHRATYGSLPEDLVALTPRFLPVLYTDPIDGAPLRYTKLDSGYAVYSVGIDLQDNLGEPQQHDVEFWLRTGDIGLVVTR